jgi:hypothetical protein
MAQPTWTLHFRYGNPVSLDVDHDIAGKIALAIDQGKKMAQIRLPNPDGKGSTLYVIVLDNVAGMIGSESGPPKPNSVPIF